MRPDVVDRGEAVVAAVDQELRAAIDGHHVGVLRDISIQISFKSVSAIYLLLAFRPALFSFKLFSKHFVLVSS